MKKKSNRKLASGALQLTVFIGVAIALILSALILLQNTHNFFIQQSNATVENVELLNSGMNYILNQEQPIRDTISIEEFTSTNQKVQIHAATWGIFEKGTVKTTHRKKILYKTALIGTTVENNNRPSLYLQDNFKPLVIVGNTSIKGNVFLPSQGVQPGYIAGEGYYGTTLIAGNMQISKSKLPELLKKDEEDLLRLIKYQETLPANYFDINQSNKIENSFLKPTKYFFSTQEITISNKILKGNLIIKSAKAITIKKSALLNDVILIAPTITIEDDVQSNFQAIATKNIVIGKRCNLEYPTALIVLKEKNTQENLNQIQVQIQINEETEIKGIIAYFDDSTEDNFKTNIILESGSSNKGEIYCEGNLELKGESIGTIYTKQFVVNKAGSIFINHIFSGQINNTNFPEEYCGLLFKDTKKGVAKWLY